MAEAAVAQNRACRTVADVTQQPTSRPAPRRVLAIGAHPDDIELGCAGALAAHRAAGDEIAVLVVTGGERGPGERGDPVGRRAEQEEAAARLGAQLLWAGFRDCEVVPNAAAVQIIEAAITEVQADQVYVHALDDSHQDHRAVAIATLGAARRMTQILHYASPSTLGFQPTVFVDITQHLSTKLEALACHRSQVKLSGMVDLDVVEATARYWGAQSRLGYAEGFMPARMVYDIARQGAVALAPTPRMTPELAGLIR